MWKLLINAALFLALASSASAEPEKYGPEWWEKQRRLEEKVIAAYAADDAEALHSLAVKEGYSLADLSLSADNALEHAAREGAPKITRYLLEHGFVAHSYIQPENNFSANIYSAIALGGSVEVLRILQASGLKLELPINEWKLAYHTPSRHFYPSCSPLLQFAAQYGKAEIIRYLATQGVNMNARCGERALFAAGTGSPTPLLALGENYWDLENKEKRDDVNNAVFALVEAGADLRARDDFNGQTAFARLMKARWLYPATAEYLKKKMKR